MDQFVGWVNNFQTMQISPNQSKWTITSSNLAYFIPAITTLYKMYKSELNKTDGSTLVIMFVFVGLLSSWSYHSCRADLTIETKTNLIGISTKHHKIPKCATCPNDTTMAFVNDLPGSEHPMSFEVSRFIDHFTAIFALVLVLVHVVPLHEKLRKLILIISMLWIILFLSGGNEAISLLPAILGFIFVLVFWYYIRNNKETGFFTRNKNWTMAFILMIGAGIVFKVSDEPYWLKHSLWHIFGALSAAFLISKTAICYQDVDYQKLKVPKAIKVFLSEPWQCK